jgi:hypothetical protein
MPPDHQVGQQGARLRMKDRQIGSEDQRVPVRRLSTALFLVTVLSYSIWAVAGFASNCSAEFEARIRLNFGTAGEFVRSGLGRGDRRSLIGAELPRHHGPTGTGSTAHASANRANAFHAQPLASGQCEGSGDWNEPV